MYCSPRASLIAVFWLVFMRVVYQKLDDVVLRFPITLPRWIYQWNDELQYKSLSFQSSSRLLFGCSKDVTWHWFWYVACPYTYSIILECYKKTLSDVCLICYFELKELNSFIIIFFSLACKSSHVDYNCTILVLSHLKCTTLHYVL